MGVVLLVLWVVMVQLKLPEQTVNRWGELVFVPLLTLSTSCRSCCGSMQVSILSSRSMMADVPMCLIIKSTKSSRFRRKSTIYKTQHWYQFTTGLQYSVTVHLNWLLPIKYQLHQDLRLDITLGFGYCDASVFLVLKAAFVSRLTCSGLRPMRMDRTLEKKLARSGLRGGSFWRKL